LPPVLPPPVFPPPVSPLPVSPPDPELPGLLEAPPHPTAIIKDRMAKKLNATRNRDIGPGPYPIMWRTLSSLEVVEQYAFFFVETGWLSTWKLTVRFSSLRPSCFRSGSRRLFCARFARDQPSRLRSGALFVSGGECAVRGRSSRVSSSCGYESGNSRIPAVLLTMTSCVRPMNSPCSTIPA
jgi:hypothetical protein